MDNCRGALYRAASWYGGLQFLARSSIHGGHRHHHLLPQYRFGFQVESSLPEVVGGTNALGENDKQVPSTQLPEFDVYRRTKLGAEDLPLGPHFFGFVETAFEGKERAGTTPGHHGK